MVASGFAALGYQIVWTQQCSLWLGHDGPAVLAVVTAFFGGLALGGLALGARIERSSRPRRWYVGCELAIALWAGILVWLGPRIGELLLNVTGVQPHPLWQWCVAFGGALLVFLPATAAMGATLPAMERLTAALEREGRSIALLYASNTLGAVLGVLGAAFFLVPTLGLAATAGVCVVLNLLCALLAFAVLPASSEISAGLAARDTGRARAVLSRLALTGVLGIGYEVLVVRVLSQVTENTVYTFALLLAVYLVGTALGAAGYRRWLQARGLRGVTSDALLAALAWACLAGTLSLFAAQWIHGAALAALGKSVGAAMAAEAALALVAFGLPTLVMGALFSHLSRLAFEAGVDFGRTLGINTLAAAAAPALLGVAVVPALGAKPALIAVVLGYLALTLRQSWGKPLVALAGVAALGLLLIAPPLRLIDVPDGGRLVYHEEGVMATVSVVEDVSGDLSLRINNRQQEGSSSTRYVDARQAWLPLLLHPRPERALFLGLGSGVTASAAAEDATLSVDAVELLPEVVAASQYFVERGADSSARSRLHVITADARRYVRASQRHYDVIVSDNFHPARSGSGSLYTIEHFAAVRERLTNGGIFCQWLPLHQLDLESLRSIVRSFRSVYSVSFALLASNSLETPVIGLVARAHSSERRGFDVAEARARLASSAVRQPLEGLGLEDEFALFGSFIGGPESLDRFAGSVLANTDDRPVVAHRAPRLAYAADSTPRQRLSSLLELLRIEPSELLPSLDSLTQRRLAAYWQARNRFIELGQSVRPSPRVEEMLAQVREPLLSVLRISPDFRPAYDPLLAMAAALARSNASDAKRLLMQLTELQPARPEASGLLTSMRDRSEGSGAAQR
jgi:spermidine synthase